MIYHTACDLFDKTWVQGRPVRLIGVAARQLSPAARQLDLFEQSDVRAERSERSERLTRAVDEIHRAVSAAVSGSMTIHPALPRTNEMSARSKPRTW